MRISTHRRHTRSALARPGATFGAQGGGKQDAPRRQAPSGRIRKRLHDY